MPTEPQTAFFSYSRDDSEFALRLAADLKAAGANVWLDQLDIAPGHRWARAIQDALNNCQRLLVILSPSSDAKRKADEEKARQMEFKPKRLDRKKTPTPAPVRDAVRQRFPLWAKGGVAIFALIVVGALVYWASLGSNPKQPVVEPQKQEAKSETRAPATTTPQVSIEQQAPPPPSVAANAESSRPKTITQAKPGRFFEVIVRAKDSAWVSIKADGKITVRGIINPTDVKTVHATEQIVFWTGNAGGVEVSFNGRPVPITDGPNEELLLEFNSHGLVSPPAADVKKPAARNCPEGAYCDPDTNLMWTMKDNGKDITWPDAEQHCKSLTLAGLSGWELPTIDELEKLYDRQSSNEYKIRKPLRLTTCCPWSSTKQGWGSAWSFNFGSGRRGVFPSNVSVGGRALCVRRSGK